MKMRAIKARLVRHARTVKAVQPLLYPVFRKKDNQLIAVVKTEAIAQELVLKTKAAKKASLYVGVPARHYASLEQTSVNLRRSTALA